MKARKKDYVNYLSPLSLHGKAILDLIDEVDEIQDENDRKLRAKKTLGEKMLLLKLEGILEFISKKYPKQKDQIAIIEFLIGEDKDNIKKYLTAINLKDSKSELRRNYKSLLALYSKIGSEEKEIYCRNKLEEFAKKG